MPTVNDVEKFTNSIEKLVKTKKLSYIDGIVLYCEERNIEVELVSKLIPDVMKSKIQLEAESLHFIRKSKSGKLPIPHI